MATTGPNPETFGREIRKQIRLTVNSEMLKLNAKLIESSPVDVGILKGGWTLEPATERVSRAIIGTVNSYFLPVEMGRAPGKGISAEGQTAVQAWAGRVLGKTGQDAKGFAFALSQKYKASGRPAVGFAGLAAPGSIPSNSSSSNVINPIAGGLIDSTFKAIDRKLKTIPPIT